MVPEALLRGSSRNAVLRTLRNCALRDHHKARRSGSPSRTRGKQRPVQPTQSMNSSRDGGQFLLTSPLRLSPAMECLTRNVSFKTELEHSTRRFVILS